MTESPRRKGDPVKKFLASAIVAIMVFSTMVVVGSSLSFNGDSRNPLKAEILENSFEREVNVTISNMFELYLKSDDYNDLGRWTGTMGVSDYWYYRTTYGEYMVRESYPFVLGLGAYSIFLTPDAGKDAGNLLNSWYRMTIDAGNITEVGMASGKDPIFIPVLGSETGKGGEVDVWFYSTYLNTDELDDLRNSGTHYGNTYYDVPTGDTPQPTTQDGYYHELQGKVNISRDAAQKILGIPDTGNLNTAFLANRTTIENDWFDDWETEGTTTYDTYTAYDYSNDLKHLYITLDDEWEDEGTYGAGGIDPDVLSLRLWCLSWGMEVLLVRYMEAAGLMTGFQAYADDWYLNLSMNSWMSNITSRSVNGYHLTAWEDPSTDVWSAAWMMESQHIDWVGNKPQHYGYTSPFEPYDPTGPVTYGPTRISYLPGTVNYQNEVNYWIAPMEADLQERENLTIHLPSQMAPGIGYTPWRAANDDLDDSGTRVAEWNANTYWGEIVLGKGCYPETGGTAVSNYYDAGTKTIHMEGPIDFPTELIPSTTLLAHGSPLFMFDVAKASSYDLDIAEAGPYYPGVPYTLEVTAMNGTGEVATVYNGTVDLTCTDVGAMFGASSHTYVNETDLGIWTTTVTFGNAGSWTIDAADENNTYFEHDIVGSLGVTAIPEFGALIIPVVGVAAMVFLLRARRRRHKSK